MKKSNKYILLNLSDYFIINLYYLNINLMINYIFEN